MPVNLPQMYPVEEKYKQRLNTKCLMSTTDPNKCHNCSSTCCWSSDVQQKQLPCTDGTTQKSQLLNTGVNSPSPSEGDEDLDTANCVAECIHIKT